MSIYNSQVPNSNAPNSQVPHGSYMNSLSAGPRLNTKTNIISGPNPQDYWFHSAGAEMPEIKEEGPFPVQGNIGSLVVAEATNYSTCSYNGVGIGSGPNCSSSFTPDTYTKTNTCGSECTLKYPESYGVKNFGFPQGSSMVTNAHQIHAFSNTRAGMAGQDSANGCYEFIPDLKSGSSTCYLNEKEVYEQVGPWNKLDMYNSLVNSKFNNGPIN